MRRFMLFPVLSVVALLALLAGCGPDDDILLTSSHAELRGTLLVEGNLAAQAVVRLERADGKLYSAYSDESGKYEFEGVDEGMYDLVAMTTRNGVDYRVRLRFLPVGSGADISLPDLDLRRSGTVRGRVLLQGAASHGGTRVSVIGTPYTTTTASDGSFSIHPIAVAFRAPAPGSPYAPSAATYSLLFDHDGYVPASVADVSVVAGDVTTLSDVTLQVADPAPRGVIHGRVALEAADDGDYSGVTVRLRGTSRYVVTTAGGWFRFEDVALGAYDVEVERSDYFPSAVEDVVLQAGIGDTDVGTVTLSRHRRLTEEFKAYALALSSDGDQLAYVDSDAAAGGSVWIAEVSNPAVRHELDASSGAVAERGLCWSASSQWIYYVKYLPHPINAYAVACVSSDGSQEHTLTSTATDYYGVEVSPDDAYIAFYRSESLYRVGFLASSGASFLATDTIEELTPVGTMRNWKGADWAMTGRLYYSAEILTADSNIWSVLGAGGGVLPLDPTDSQLNPVSLPIAWPTFRADYGKVAFCVEQGSASPVGIYVCDVDGYNAVRICEQPGAYLQWSPDGRRIYYLDSEGYVCELIVPSSLR